jgi:hypothetical protein
MSWRQFPFANTTSLTYGATYWIVMRRTTPSINAYYIVDVNEEATYAAGQVKVSADNGATWSVRSPAADFPFRIVGRRETTEQLADILAANEEFDTVLIQDASGIETEPFREGSSLAYDELLHLLEMGTSTLERLLLTVLEDRTVLVRKQPASSALNYILDHTDVLRHAAGARVEPGMGIAGEWVSVNLLLLNEEWRSRSLFATVAEYSAAEDFLTFATEGNRKPAYLARTRQG